MNLLAADLLTHASQLADKQLATVAEGADFRLSVGRNRILIIPSTRKQRSVSQNDIQRVCDRFAEIRSMRPGDYKDISRNASYILTLIESFLAADRADNSKSLLIFARDIGCDLKVTGKGGTTRIEFDNHDLGYVNSTIKERQGFYGYKFYSERGFELRSEKSDGVPHDGVKQAREVFQSLYGKLAGQDWHEGDGATNQQNRYLTFTDFDSAKAVLQADIATIRGPSKVKQANDAKAGGSQLFFVGESYTRHDVYELLKVPEEKRRGNWETGYNRWGDDLFIFSTVGSAATGGYDYQNRWEGDVFEWYAKEGTTLQQLQIQWMLNPTGNVFIFTRPAVRNPFTFEGIATPETWRDTSPVLIRWKVNRNSYIVLPSEESTAQNYVEGATRQVFVNSYERNPAARQKCVEHYGFRCSVCGFSFSEYYGEIGNQYIHVHHLKDLAAVGAEYEVDPISDLRPVCPNCHAMLHTDRPAMSIDELKQRIQKRGGAIG